MKYAIEDIIKVRDAFAAVQTARQVPPGHTEQEMIRVMFKYAQDRKLTGDQVVEYKHYYGACGCMGPKDGEPLCRCAMGVAMESYKYDVALMYAQEGIE